MTAQDGHDTTAGMPGDEDARPQVPEMEPADGGATKERDDRFLIVGIGSSAGGLAPLEEFFQAVPPGTDIAFVVIQHLAPTRESILSQLLARDTRIQVRQVMGDTPVEPGAVYVIPPGKELILDGGMLRLEQRESAGERFLPIDTFFRSLAAERGEWGVGIILSGAGADGTLGVRAIKEAGGLVIVQDPEGADQSSMPRSAIATGLVDYILPAGQMPGALHNYVEHFLNGALAGAERVRIEDGQAMANILAVLRTRTGHDFALYKRNTVTRRVHRRMTVRQIRSIADYAAHLLQDSQEIRALFGEMLIGVTEFFRDPEAFQLLADEVIPELIEAASVERPLRVWVAACATGEEAYSIAIVIREKMEEMGRQVPVQIFATDIDERAVAVARHGRYPTSIIANVSSERLARFFEQIDGGYAVTESVRKMIVFAPQSMVKDPPFSHVNLVTCRNFLIYLEPELQRSIVGVFEYALDPGGYLLLGTSEMLPGTAPYFELVDGKWKLFRRREGRAPLTILPDLSGATWSDTLTSGTRAVPQQPHLRQELERVLLENYSPATLVVDQDGRILFAYGDVGPCLQPSPGATGGWHVMQMLRQGLRVPVATGIRHATAQRTAVRHPGLVVDGRQVVDVTVRPIERPAALDGFLLVEFYQAASPRLPAEPLPDTATEPVRDSQVEKLERELQSTKEYLQAVVEEVQSSNEEIRSTNEELQSANEELETSQEEAQSVNEELVTLNSELESRVDELTWANSDMINVLASIDVGIIFLDRHFHVRRFNRAAARIVNLIPGDVGRPVTHMSSNLVDSEWVEQAHAVFETLTPHEQEVRTQDGRWYLMRIRPYRTVEDAIEGVVLSFSDITEQKQAQRAARGAQVTAESIVHTVRQPLLILTEDLRVQSANRAFYEAFRVAPSETEGRLVYELEDGQWNNAQLRALLEEIIPENESFEGYEVEHEFERIGRRKVILDARRVSVDGRPALVMLAFDEAE